MKLQTQQSITADTLELTGNILNISGTDYDLSNPQELPEDVTDENKRVYLDSEGNTCVSLKTDPPSSPANPDCKGRDFMFTKTWHKIDGKNVLVSNLMLFYDVNNDDDISIDEFKTIVDHWNMSEDDRRAAHKTIRDNFLNNNPVEDWLKKGIVSE